MKSVCVVVTTPFAVNAFLLSHLRGLADAYAVTLCVNTSLYPLSPSLDPRVRLIDFPIAREISFWRDLRALLFLVGLFRIERFRAVHSVTPKAGLLAMVAAWVARIPHRFHTFTGQVWATKQGVARTVLKACDRLIVWAASQVFADSASQCRVLEHEGIVSPGGIAVLGPGSISGVDVHRFQPDAEARRLVRSQFAVPDRSVVCVFVGRLTRDKGVVDLVDALATVASHGGDVELWLVGPDEEGLGAVLTQRAGQWAGRLRCLGPTLQPERFMAAADILVLPSYREGFGSVVIEAAACAVPTVAYRIDGIVDAVVPDETGILVELGNIPAFGAAMAKLVQHAALRHTLGHQALARVRREFSSAAVTAEWVSFYQRTV